MAGSHRLSDTLATAPTLFIHTVAEVAKTADDKRYQLSQHVNLTDEDPAVIDVVGLHGFTVI